MTRQAVYRYEMRQYSDGPFVVGINLNDEELRLDAYLDYKLSEHLEDLDAMGLALISVTGDVHTFSDGSQQILQQREDDVDLDALDAETIALLASAA
jgi:hypothetical protein